MKKNTFEEVETLLEHYPKVLTLRLYGDGASEETVKEAEQILNVTFPEDYRKFLKKWGYLYLKDISEWIYGIAFDDIKERRENAIIETIELREWSALPEYFVAFIRSSRFIMLSGMTRNVFVSSILPQLRISPRLSLNRRESVSAVFTRIGLNSSVFKRRRALP